jgi:hypothetical protein
MNPNTIRRLLTTKYLTNQTLLGQPIDNKFHTQLIPPNPQTYTEPMTGLQHGHTIIYITYNGILYYLNEHDTIDTQPNTSITAQP